MVDIAMCRRRDCDRRLTCFRYLADAEEVYQTYIEPSKVGKECEKYWQVKNKRDLAYMNRVNR